MSAEIQKFINEFKTLKWKSKPYEFTCRLIDNHPEEVPALMEMMLHQIPDAGNVFADAISFVPESELPRLAEVAIEKLRKGGQLENAEEFISHLSLQRVESLHPYLDEIYELKPNWATYYSDWPWRKSGLLQFEKLKRVAEQVSDVKASNKAWSILLETRHPTVLEYCSKHVDVVGNIPDDDEFHEIGFEPRNGTFRQLYENSIYHIIFPETYWQKEGTPIHMIKRHPTWRLAGAPSSGPFRFGGLGEHVCPACGQAGHNLLSLAQVPKGLSILGLPQISFETCLSCLGWGVPRLFYQHDNKGEVKPLGYEGRRIVPEFPSEPFLETQIHLAETPPRWQWQDWAVTNSRESLHRFGGYPCWIQGAEYLPCPLCRQTMSFLFQLDSELKVGSENSKQSFEWGSGGICYAQWCQSCKVSGYLWQCT